MFFRKTYGYLLLVVSSFFELCVSFFIYKFCSTRYGVEGFSQLSLYKRALAWMLPLLLFGIPLAIPYLAPRKKVSLLAPSLLLYIVTGLCLCFLFLLWGRELGGWMMSTSDRGLVGALLLCALGLGLCEISLAVQRSRISYGESFVFLLLVRSIIPFCLFFSGYFSLSATLTIQGIVWLFVAIIYLLFSFKREEFPTHFGVIGDIVKYGGVRIPGELAWFGLLALPAIWVSKENFIAGGVTGFSISLLSVFGSMVQPLGYSLLPQTSHLAHTQNFNELRREVKNTFWAVGALSLVATLFFSFFLKASLKWMGVEMPALLMSSSSLILAIFPYGIYVGFRCILDGLSPNNGNTLNLVATFIFYGTLIWIFPKLYVVGFILALFLLAFLTIGSVYLCIWRQEKKVTNSLPSGIEVVNFL